MSFYPLDEGSGTVTEDTVGTHDASLVNGPAWTTGHAGSALQFNGSNQYADTGAAILDTTGNYSVSAWVKLDRLGSFATAVSQDGDTNSAFYLQYSGQDNRFAFSFAGCPGPRTVRAADRAVVPPGRRPRRGERHTHPLCQRPEGRRPRRPASVTPRRATP